MVKYEKANPFAIVDEECEPPWVVARYEKQEQAEFHLNLLRDRGGVVLRNKVLRGGYSISGPEHKGCRLPLHSITCKDH